MDIANFAFYPTNTDSYVKIYFELSYLQSPIRPPIHLLRFFLWQRYDQE